MTKKKKTAAADFRFEVPADDGGNIDIVQHVKSTLHQLSGLNLTAMRDHGIKLIDAIDQHLHDAPPGDELNRTDSIFQLMAVVNCLGFNAQPIAMGFTGSATEKEIHVAEVMYPDSGTNARVVLAIFPTLETGYRVALTDLQKQEISVRLAIWRTAFQCVYASNFKAPPSNWSDEFIRLGTVMQLMQMMRYSNGVKLFDPTNTDNATEQWTRPMSRKEVATAMGVERRSVSGLLPNAIAKATPQRITVNLKKAGSYRPAIEKYLELYPTRPKRSATRSGS